MTYRLIVNNVDDRRVVGESGSFLEEIVVSKDHLDGVESVGLTVWRLLYCRLWAGCFTILSGLESESIVPHFRTIHLTLIVCQIGRSVCSFRLAHFERSCRVFCRIRW